MKRYYYTDALAAAWMADKFGMKFIFSHAGIDYSLLHWQDLFPPSKNLKYYIHPDSLPILEPHEADTLLYSNCTYHGIVGLSIGTEKAKKQIATGWRIILRGETPFYWPTSE